MRELTVLVPKALTSVGQGVVSFVVEIEGNAYREWKRKCRLEGVPDVAGSKTSGEFLPNGMLSLFLPGDLTGEILPVLELEDRRTGARLSGAFRLTIQRRSDQQVHVHAASHQVDAQGVVYQPIEIGGIAGSTVEVVGDHVRVPIELVEEEPGSSVPLADLAAREGLWLHVDAAYGGCFALTERGQLALRGLGRADSITLDPHKGLFLPYGTGALLVREPAALRRAHASRAEYLPPMQEDPDFVDFCELSPELSRDFRGLRLWLPLKLVGAGAFAAALDEKLDLAQHAHRRLGELPGVEIVAAPQLSLLAFRHVPDGLRGDAAALDRHNERLLAAINRRARVYLTATVLDGRFVLRICVLSFRTHRDRVDAGLADIAAAIAELS